MLPEAHCKYCGIEVGDAQVDWNGEPWCGSCAIDEPMEPPRKAGMRELIRAAAWLVFAAIASLIVSALAVWFIQVSMRFLEPRM